MALTDPRSGEDDDTGYDYYDTPAGNIWRPCAELGQPSGDEPGRPDTGPYEVIHLGGQAAIVVPVTDFLRLRALELHAFAEELKDAEDAAAPARRATRSGEGAARVAQSALLREVPATVAAGRLATRYVSAAAGTRVGGDLLEIVSDKGHPRWLIGHTRGKGLPAVRLASVAMTSFRDACAQPGLSLPEIAWVVDRSVARAAEDEDFVTAVFAEFDPRGWLQLVTCGHPPPLRLTGDGDLRALTPTAYATPLGRRPDIRPSTFSVGAGDRLVFYTDGLLEARDRAGRYFRLEDCRDTLRRTDLQAAADELLDRLLAHTGRRLDDDVAVLLFEAASPPARPEDQPAAAPAPAGDTLPGGEPPGAAASGFLGRPAARKR